MMFLNNYSDTYIIETIQKNNSLECNKVFKYLYKKHYQKVKAFVSRNSGTEHDTEDLFQDALIALINQIRKGNFNEKSKISTYLFAIARNLWLLELKSRSKSETSLSEDHELMDDSLMEKLFDKRKNLQLLSKIFNKLEDNSFQILKYFYFDGLTISEIQKILGLGSEQAVRTKKYRSMLKLISYLKENKITKESFMV